MRDHRVQAKGMNNVKSKAILIGGAFTVLVVVAVVAFTLLSSSSGASPRRPLLDKGEGLRQGEIILAKTWAGQLGVQKGDVFPYYVEVWYDPAAISEIDKASLDKEMNLHPFEIRDIKENSFKLASRTIVYQRIYEVQLVSGQVDELYEFPTALVRYRLKGSPGLSNTSVTPEPVYVAPRVPPDVPDLQFGYGPLRPIAGKRSEVSAPLPWILWAVGACFTAVGAVTLARRSITGWNNSKAQRNQGGEGWIVRDAYRSLSENAAATAEPRVLLHQMDRILRIVLAQKEKMGWLEELDGEQVSPEIREPVAALLQRCGKAYNRSSVEPTDVKCAWHHLDQILEFYFGEADLEAWRS